LHLVLDMLSVDQSTNLSFPDPRAAFVKGIASMQISEVVSIGARPPKEAAAMVWWWLYYPQFGLFNVLLRLLHLPPQP
jgi:hypothetical protein